MDPVVRKFLIAGAAGKVLFEVLDNLFKVDVVHKEWSDLRDFCIFSFFIMIVKGC